MQTEGKLCYIFCSIKEGKEKKKTENKNTIMDTWQKEDDRQGTFMLRAVVNLPSLYRSEDKDKRRKWIFSCNSHVFTRWIPQRFFFSRNSTHYSAPGSNDCCLCSQKINIFALLLCFSQKADAGTKVYQWWRHEKITWWWCHCFCNIINIHFLSRVPWHISPLFSCRGKIINVKVYAYWCAPVDK